MSQRPIRIIIYPLFNFEICDSAASKIASGFKFSNNVLLRRIGRDEIRHFHDTKETHPTMWSDGAYLIFQVTERTWVYEISDVVSRSNQKVEDRAASFITASSRLIYEVELAKKLHKPETGFCKIFYIEEDSQLISRGVINPPAPYEPRNCILDITELEEIDKLVGRISKLDLDNNTPFRVACERFSRSHEERRNDDKIIDLAIAFEALFTASVATSKIEYMGEFVGLGCSMLLGKDNREREEIKQFLVKAFSVRNKLVHGSGVKFPFVVGKKKICGLNEITVQLQNYLRASIIKLM